MHIALSTLVENTAGWLGFLGEWGLSILVEVDDTTILVDMGRTDVAARNAHKMKIDLEKIDKAMFSHGHMDHTGGLIALLKSRDRARTPMEVIAHPDVWSLKYSRSADGNYYDYAGIPYARKLAESLGAEFKMSSEPHWITDKIVVSGEVPMLTEFEAIDEGLYEETESGYIRDPLRDDQSLFIVSDKGLILICGCAHRGIVNTIRHAQKLTGCDEVHAIVGGIHLFRASQDRVIKTLDEFKRLDVQRIGVSHCTGPSAGSFLAGELGNRFFFNQAGTRTEFKL